MIKVPTLGQPLLRIEKSCDDIIVYQFEPPLEINEIVTKGSTINYRSRKGKSIEFVATSVKHTGAAPYIDETIKIMYKTNLGNTRSFLPLLGTLSNV